jgi:hypothetical protein
LPIYVSTVTCDDGSIDVTPTSGNVVIHIDTTHTNVWGAEQDFVKLVKIDVSAESPAGYVGLEFVGNLGGSPIDLFQLNTNGNHYLSGRFNILGIDTGSGYNLRVRQSVNSKGVFVLVHATTTEFPLSIERGGSQVQFGIGINGEFITDVLGATAPTGGPVGYIAVYDSSGTLLGYITVDAP